MRRYVAEEWEPIPFGQQGVDRQELEAIDDRAKSIGISDLFEWGRTQAKPRNWLGLVRGNNVELQIVPKGWLGLNDRERTQLQSTLVNLLALSRGLRISSVSVAAVTPEATLQEYLYRLYLDTCRLALRRRAMRTYRTAVEISAEIRGALVFPDETLHRITSPTTFVTSYTELTWNNPFNRVLAAACACVVRSRRTDLRAGAQLVAANLRVEPDEKRISQDRRAARRLRLEDLQERCLALAELILDSSYGLGVFAGDLELGAQLVSTSGLWEAGVTALAQRTAGTTVVAQPRGHYALKRIAGDRTEEILEIRPDMLVVSPRLGVMDAKWKILDPGKPAIGADDGHQVLDYGRHYGVPRVVLLMPDFRSNISGAQMFTWQASGSGTSIEVAVVLLPLLRGLVALEGAVRDALEYAIADSDST
jgi:5-methylcytosine-specific restriction endonuclease McrBC regulatory subunit McrC